MESEKVKEIKECLQSCNDDVCDDFLNPKTETVKSWGITADESYIKTLEKIKKREVKK